MARTAISFPDSWTIEMRDDGAARVVGDGVIAEIDALRFRPQDLRAFLRERVALDAKHSERTTRDGWHYRLFEQASGFVACYLFLDYVGMVNLSGDVVVYRNVLVDCLDAARPEWRSADVFALCQIFEK